MIGLVEILLVPLLLLTGIGLAWTAARSYAHARRVREVPTRSVRELAEGVAELRGTLRTSAPITTVDGVAAIAVRRVATARVRDEDDPRSLEDGHVAEEVLCAPVELEDETGTCELTLDQVLIVGDTRRHELSREDFRSRFPALYQECNDWQGGGVLGVRVEETFVRDDVYGFVSGVAVADEARAASGDDAVAPRPRFRMVGSDERPLIVSSWTEREVHQYLLVPVLRLAWIAGLCWFLAGVAIHAYRLAAAAAGQ